MEIHGMAGHLIRRLNQLSTQVFAARTRDAGFDLTPVQFAALDAVRANPGLDQAGIAAEIAYDRATIGGVIDRLEQKGLVTRTVNEKDRRARQVNLSDKGAETYEKILPIVRSFQQEILAGLDDNEKQQFLGLAQKIVSQ